MSLALGVIKMPPSPTPPDLLRRMAAETAQIEYEVSTEAYPWIQVLNGDSERGSLFGLDRAPPDNADPQAWNQAIDYLIKQGGSEISHHDRAFITVPMITGNIIHGRSRVVVEWRDSSRRSEAFHRSAFNHARSLADGSAGAEARGHVQLAILLHGGPMVTLTARGVQSGELRSTVRIVGRRLASRAKSLLAIVIPIAGWTVTLGFGEPKTRGKYHYRYQPVVVRDPPAACPTSELDRYIKADPGDVGRLHDSCRSWFDLWDSLPKHGDGQGSGYGHDRSEREQVQNAAGEWNDRPDPVRSRPPLQGEPSPADTDEDVPF